MRRKNPVTMKPLTRACTRCGARPPMAQFSTRTVAGKTYRHSWCLDCQRALNREYKSRKRDLETNGLGVPFGSHHPRSKLTEADVLLIWGLIESGLSNGVIAEKFEVAPATIWTIRAGKSWKHCHPRYAAEGAGVASHP